MHYLNHHARKGTAYLHPGGAAYTEILILELGLKLGMRVLEIGCGTAASIVSIAKRFQVQCTAVDISASMLESARKRAAMEGCKQKITFIGLTDNGKLPFADHSFDVVFAESALGITDEIILPFLLGEISRVLIPGGIFASNDAIWKDHVSEKEIRRINAACLKDFGVIQSTAVPAKLEQWKKTFTDTGFIIKKTIEITPRIYINNKPKKGLFQYYKKFIWFLNVRVCFQEFRYRKALQKNHRHDNDFLNSYIFVMQNP